MGVDGQRHAPAALPAGMSWYSLYKKLGGSQSWSGRVRKISCPPVSEPRTVLLGKGDWWQRCLRSVHYEGWNSKPHERAHSNSTFVTVLSQINPAQVLSYCFFKIHSNIIHATLCLCLPSAHFHTGLKTRFPYVYSFQTRMCIQICIYMRYSSTILIFLDSITQLVLGEKLRHVIY